MFPLLSTSVIAKLFARFGSAFFLTFHCCCFISFRPFSILRWSYVLFAGLQWCFHGTHEELGLAKGRSKYTDFRHYTTEYGHTHTTHRYAPTHFTKIHYLPVNQTAHRTLPFLILSQMFVTSGENLLNLVCLLLVRQTSLDFIFSNVSFGIQTRPSPPKLTLFTSFHSFFTTLQQNRPENDPFTNAAALRVCVCTCVCA